MGLGYIVKNTVKNYFSDFEQSTTKFLEYKDVKELLESIEGETEYNGNGKEILKGKIKVTPGINGEKQTHTERKEALEYLVNSFSPENEAITASYQVFTNPHTFIKKHYLCLEAQEKTDEHKEIPLIPFNVPGTENTLKITMEFETYKPAYTEPIKALPQYQTKVKK